ncbi:hypothetical protein DLAC_05239 [Tieghemostelium lacteum]|uniref:RBR-type E3 ubiquitin transferase n=1 Tax=Tieghemostelium lacteum TaxID=361077 RepID=A0A151ZIX6_TIELA|nr:hypothetical protein DLAC_05239 [Tieghemostelium lacteum]|eukprot:KYQ93840.1 hypothetical protein DLAC_05239 [Tieghemostelium lacteum]
MGESLELQQQEIQVLKSIFDDSLVLYKDNTLYSYYQIKINVLLKDSFKLIVNRKELQSNENNSNNNNNTNENIGNDNTQEGEEAVNTTTTTTTTSTTTNVITTNTVVEDNENTVIGNGKVETISYPVVSLPFVTLKFDLPVDYPMESAPRFKISSCWLNLDQMDKVVDYLDSQWSSGEFVIFKYIDWIKNEMMQFLGIENELYLTQIPVLREIDNGQLDEQQPPEEKEKKKEKEEEEPDALLKRFWETNRCRWEHQMDWVSTLSTLPTLLSHNLHESRVQFSLVNHECPICYIEYPASECTLLTCLHYQCNECLKMFINVNIEDGKVQMLKCTDLTCTQPIDQRLIKKFTTPSLYERYEFLIKQLDPLQTKCINCEKGWAFIDRVTNSSYCFSCYFSTCLGCRKAFHPGLSCRGTVSRGNSNKQLLVPVGETRYCPKCSALIMKSEGCNKMQCANCSTKFCWVCVKPISGYEHFKNNPVCQLFELPKDLDSDFHPTTTRDDHRYQMLYYRSTTGHTQCTKCRDKIYQYDNNNYVFCFTCYKHVCFLCKQFISGTKHFMTSKCNQHGNPDK